MQSFIRHERNVREGSIIYEPADSGILDFNPLALTVKQNERRSTLHVNLVFLVFTDPLGRKMPSLGIRDDRKYFGDLAVGPSTSACGFHTTHFSKRLEDLLLLFLENCVKINIDKMDIKVICI